MRFVVGWGRDDDLPNGQPRVAMQTVQELDLLLDLLERERGVDGAPFVVEIADEDSGDGFVTYHLQITVGYQGRAAVHYVGVPAGGVGVESGLAVWTGGEVTFDENGEPTTFGADQLRVTPEVARGAAREYVRTGLRPTNVWWER